MKADPPNARKGRRWHSLMAAVTQAVTVLWTALIVGGPPPLWVTAPGLAALLFTTITHHACLHTRDSLSYWRGRVDELNGEPVE